MGAGRRLIRWAVIAALGGWLFKRRRSSSPAPEGTWRDIGSDTWNRSGTP